MKKIILNAAAFVLALCMCANVFAAKSVNELQKEKENIKEKADSTQELLNETQSEKSSVNKQVEELDAELSAVQDEVDRLTNQLSETENELSKSEAELKQASENKENQYNSLKNRMAVMYEEGAIGYIQIILESDGFSDFLKRAEYIGQIMEYDQNVFKNYELTEKTIEAKTSEIRTEKERIEVLKTEQQSRQSDLNEKLAEKQELAEKLAGDEASYLQQLSDLEKEDKEVSNLIIEAENAERAAAAAAAQSSDSADSSGSSAGKVYAASGGNLQYPVPNYRGYQYNSPYGYRTSPIRGGIEFHTGVDLKATMGTDIVAAESGTVIYSGNKGGYGKTVIIDHGNGMSTLYAHNSSLVVSVGEHVQRGQVISKAGTTGYSTGVHLHFEVRINGNHTNPAPYIGH